MAMLHGTRNGGNVSAHHFNCKFFRKRNEARISFIATQPMLQKNLTTQPILQKYTPFVNYSLRPEKHVAVTFLRKPPLRIPDTTRGPWSSPSQPHSSPLCAGALPLGSPRAGAPLLGSPARRRSCLAPHLHRVASLSLFPCSFPMVNHGKEKARFFFSICSPTAAAFPELGQLELSLPVVNLLSATPPAFPDHPLSLSRDSLPGAAVPAQPKAAGRSYAAARSLPPLLGDRIVAEEDLVLVAQQLPLQRARPQVRQHQPLFPLPV
uniref:Uncharacterized protein n=1 Tax=Triticum urartu TaxID=4572 RepID=A0A8R7TFR8_TRIUA